MKLVASGLFNWKSILNTLKRFKSIESEKKKVKITKLYLCRIKIYEEFLEFIPEYRNENYTKWGICIAKMKEE
jgi:hypothetical protein